ncbi:MAG: transcriptional regulator [Ponticaulis sp.]|nr:transcriptional regulator [Ponticaulis sp.]
MRWSEVDEVACPIAQGLSVIGDAWTLLIIRDCFKGYSRFEDFQSQTKASRATLSARLSRLVDDGILEKRPYQEHPPRHEYFLTERGKSLLPVLMTLSDWAQTQLGAPSPPQPRVHTSCGHTFKPVVHCSECGEPVENNVTFGGRRQS